MRYTGLMISRYALYDIAELRDHFSLAEGLPKGIKPRYNNSPTIDAPVILSQEGARVAKLMKWGLVAKGAKDTSSVFRYKTYNIPAERIFSKHSWERAVHEKRCLIPANGFYELSSSGDKRAHYVRSKDRQLLAFAGVYGLWEDPQGVTHGTFSLITVETAHDAPTMGGRMPLVIPRENEDRWLDPSVTDVGSLYEMLRPYPTELLSGYEVGAAVHSPKINQSSLIDPVN